jgi:hypothetical protein
MSEVRQVVIRRYCPYCGRLQSFYFEADQYAKATLFLKLSCRVCDGVFHTGKKEGEAD